MRFILNRKFERKYAKLSYKIKEKFIERRNIFIQDPTSSILNIHKLSREYKGKWSINITGDYRAIFDRSERDIIIFVNIGTHSELFG